MRKNSLHCYEYAAPPPSFFLGVRYKILLNLVLHCLTHINNVRVCSLPKHNLNTSINRSYVKVDERVVAFEFLIEFSAGVDSRVTPCSPVIKLKGCRVGLVISIL